MARCCTCDEGLLYRTTAVYDGPVTHAASVQFRLYECELIWPQPSSLHISVPVTVRKCYEEAAAIKSLAPNAFANQIRRSLEALCKDRNTTGGVLAQKLKDLAERGEIPPHLASMTDVLRKLGNMGSHAGDEEVDPSYVPVIDDFFRAIVEYVYIAPHRVAEFEARLAAARASDDIPF